MFARRWASLSARRAWIEISAWGRHGTGAGVALRKESVDRNNGDHGHIKGDEVALRKESVDRNQAVGSADSLRQVSLSARRAWIEIQGRYPGRKSDRSLSARRAWIEIRMEMVSSSCSRCRSPQGERG